MNKNKLITAYGELLQHFHETMDEALHTFADAFEISKHKTSQSSELSPEQLDKVSGYVKRDLEHAAHGLPATTDNNSLTEWFKFDVEMLENFALDAFLSLADKTRIELVKLQQLATKYSYHSGEITSPGTFICDACGKEIAFKTPSEIPECPKCHATTFVRI